MENRLEGNKENLSPEQAVAKAALLGECDTLAAAGVTFVAVHFDGCGDDGATEHRRKPRCDSNSRISTLNPEGVM